MTAGDVLAVAHDAGLTLLAEGENIRWRGPKGTFTPELKAEVVRHKSDLVFLLSGVLPAPDARALLGHCTRVRPDTSTTAADVQNLAEHFTSLTREKAIEAELRLWPWWKGTTTPTVGAFLQTEGKPRP